MYVLIFLVVIFLVCVIWKVALDSWDSFAPELGMFLTSIAVAFMLMSLAAYRVGAHTRLAQRDSLQRTYAELRSRPLEMAAVGGKIADWNAWLASAQYWHETQWRYWWPDAVMSTQPIQ